MKCYSSGIGGRVLIIRLNKGDFLRESIETALKDNRIKDGTVVCGYGALDYCSLSAINKTEVFPPEMDVSSWENSPLELVSLTGLVADGVPHIHVVVSERNRAIGGHLEYGCRVLYLAEIIIYEHANLKLIRKPTEWGPLALELKEE